MSELIDTTAPNSARVWNYWLGGKDHYPADARIGQYCASFYPGMAVLARSCRYFTARVIGYLASQPRPDLPGYRSLRLQQYGAASLAGGGRLGGCVR